jgi:hypothetical protein
LSKAEAENDLIELNELELTEDIYNISKIKLKIE